MRGAGGWAWKRDSMANKKKPPRDFRGRARCVPSSGKDLEVPALRADERRVPGHPPTFAQTEVQHSLPRLLVAAMTAAHDAAAPLVLGWGLVQPLHPHA